MHLKDKLEFIFDTSVYKGEVIPYCNRRFIAKVINNNTGEWRAYDQYTNQFMELAAIEYLTPDSLTQEIGHA